MSRAKKYFLRIFKEVAVKNGRRKRQLLGRQSRRLIALN